MSSSDEAEESSPVLPRDSDRGSSVSSLLQDEYEELLRSAVVTPRLDAAGGGQLLLGTSFLRSMEEDEHGGQRPLAGTSSSPLRSLHSPEGDDHARHLHPAAAAGRSASRASSSSRTPTPTPRQMARSPTPSHRPSSGRPPPEKTSSSSSPPRGSRQAGRSPLPSQRSSRQAGRSPLPSQRSSRQAGQSPLPSQRSSRQRERSRTPPSSSHRSRPRSRHSERTPSPTQRSTASSRQSGPKPPSSDVPLLTELFICEENISQMETLLDTWSVHLKSNVVAELRRWRLLFVEQHQRELERERDKARGLRAEADDLQQLLEAYQTSGHRKDTVIAKLTAALDRQREKVDMMRTLTHWRLQHARRQDEAHALHRAQQHHRAALQRKAFLGWRSVLRSHWKEAVERDCRARAQDVCTQLAAQYDAKLAEHVQALEAAQAETERLRLERERYEDAMKKAFMRGVCALNMEALSMFHNAEDTDGAESAAIGPFPSHPGSSTHFGSAHFDPVPPPSQNSPPEEAIDSTTEGLPSTSVIHSSLPPGGTAGSQSAPHTVVTSSSAAPQQKPSGRTMTARITARHAPSAAATARTATAAGRSHPAKKNTAAPHPHPHPDLVKTTRSRLQVMGVAPPMSSVMVERHHPVTQLTMGQATAATFPRPSQQQHHHVFPGGKPLPHGSAHSSSCDPTHARRPHLSSLHTHSSCDTHAIKIVD